MMRAYEAFERYLDQPCDWDVLGQPITNRQVIGKHEAYALGAFYAAWHAQQAEIDRLTLEHCPDEMTPQQKAEWAAHQKPDPDQLGRLIQEALQKQDNSQVEGLAEGKCPSSPG